MEVARQVYPSTLRRKALLYYFLNLPSVLNHLIQQHRDLDELFGSKSTIHKIVGCGQSKKKDRLLKQAVQGILPGNSLIEDVQVMYIAINRDISLLTQLR